MRSFEGKVALVTGGSSGLGAATALQFAREGARVVIAARRTDQSEAVLRQIAALGAEGLFVRTDVSSAADIQAMVQNTLARFGRLDFAVNNAGITGPVRTPVADVDEAQWDIPGRAVCCAGAIGDSAAIARELATDCRRRAPELRSD